MNIRLFQTLCYFFSVHWLLALIYYPVYGNFTESFLTENVSATKTHGKLRRNLQQTAIVTLTPPEVVACSTATLTWTITTPQKLVINSFVTITFEVRNLWAQVDFTTATVSGQFTITSSSSIFVEIKNTAECSNCAITISNLKIPALSGQQKWTVEINGISTASEALNIKPLTHTGSVIPVGKSYVTETGQYKVILPQQCNSIRYMPYTITIPPMFKSSTSGNQITGSLNGWAPDTQAEIIFSLINPSSKRGPGDFIGQTFTITISSGVNALLDMTAVFNNAIDPGVINPFSVIPTSPNAGDHCNYNFIMSIPHPIPNNGRIKLKFHSAVTITSTYSLEPIGIFKAPSISNNDEITAEFGMPLAFMSDFKVTVLNVVNPVFTGTYGPFEVITYDNDNNDDHIIDQSVTFSLEINQYGSGAFDCTSDNKVNLAVDKYTCSFKSTYIPIPYTVSSTDINYLDISLPNELKNCVFDPSIYASSATETSARYTIRGPSTVSAITIAFKCENPSSTRPTNNLEATLSYASSSPNKILIQSFTKVKTATGAELETCKLTSNNNCPRCKGSCVIEIEQAKSTSVSYIQIENSLISSSTDECIVNNVRANCEYSIGKVLVKVPLTATPPYTVTLPSVTNPDNIIPISGQFSIITYEDLGRQFKVDEDVWEASGTGKCALSVKCNFPCKECEGGATQCTSCAPGYLHYGTNCDTSCPSGTIALEGICEDCHIDCLECAKAKDYCTICANDRFLSNGKCFDSCPRQTTEPISGKTCVECGAGCDVCDKSNPDVCTTCTIGYKYLNFLCYRTCPNNYIASDDELECIKGGNSGGQFFPHLITVVLLGIITAAGQSRDGRAMMISNLVVVINYVAISSYIVQIAYGLKESESLAAIVTIAIVLIQIILNFLFCIPYNKYIKQDVGFGSWVKANTCTHRIILALSTIFTLQTERFFYSRFLGFDLFFAKFVDFGSLVKPLNYFSIAQIIVVQFPVVIIDIVELTKLTWGTTLYTTLIESLVLSLLLLILIAYEIKSVQATQLYLAQSTDEYSKLNDNSMSNQFTGYTSKPLDEERLRKEIFDEVFQKISFTLRLPKSDRFQRSDKKPERRQSYSKGTDYPKEKDTKKSKSYPCSPKTAKEKEIPFKKYRLNEDKVVPPDKLGDNVLADTMPPKKGRIVVPMNDLGMQTIPFEKIEIFRRHMNLKGGKKKKMFEHTPNPLAAIPENYEDEDEERKKKIEEAKKINNQLMSEGIITNTI